MPMCYCFHSQWFIVMSYCIHDLSVTNIFVLSLRHNFYAPIERFYCFPLKAIEINGFYTTGFLRNFVVLMYLFIFVDFLKSYCWKEFHAVKKLIDNGKFFSEKLLFDGFENFLAQFFWICGFCHFFYSLVRRYMVTGLRNLYSRIQGDRLHGAISF